MNVRMTTAGVRATMTGSVLRPVSASSLVVVAMTRRRLFWVSSPNRTTNRSWPRGFANGSDKTRAMLSTTRPQSLTKRIYYNHRSINRPTLAYSLRGGDQDGADDGTNTTRSRGFTTVSSSTSQQSHKDHLSHRVYIAVGSNLGDRHFNIRKGLEMLCSPDYDDETYQNTKLMKTSFLYHTAPMYVIDQPPFLNGVIQIETDLQPLHLLTRMKRIERDLGRNFTQIRNGPRPLDLDILLYYNQTTSTACNDDDNDNNATKKGSDYNGIDWAPWMINETDPVALIVPHPRIAEREFVLAPLVDLAGRDLQHPMTIDQTTNANATFGQLLDNLLISQQHGDRDEQLGASRLIPLPLGRFLLFPPPPDSATLVMGILNVTPDSFSDGGQFNANITKAVDQAFQMVQDGARIIDIGGESTRPGAKEVSIEEQIQRIIPVIEGIRSREQQGVINSNNQKESSTLEKNSRIKIVNSDVDESRHIDVVISVDTRHAAVARAAIHAGADIVNDVSGGTFDPDMLPTVAELGVPIIMMHMRGTPETMQQMTDYGKDGDSVVDSVIESLIDRSNAASSAGIPRWMQILDVGIGFAKDFDGNLDLLKNYKKIRSETGGLPLLLGTSRKGFLGKLTGEAVASDRDYATIGSCLATICLGASWSSSTSSFGDGTSNSIFDLGCNILRVHNVKAVHQATMVMDAIVNK